MRGHQHKVGISDWARPIVDRGAAGLQQVRLSADGQLVFGIDHRFVVNRPAALWRFRIIDRA